MVELSTPNTVSHPNSSCNAIAGGIVLDSACVASVSFWGEQAFPGLSRVSLSAETARPEGKVLLPRVVTHPQPRTQVRRARREVWAERGRRGARYLNFDRTAAGL